VRPPAVPASGHPDQAGARCRGAPHRAAHPRRRHPGQDREEMARHDRLGPHMAGGHQHPQSAVPDRAAQQGVGRGHHLRLDHGGLTLPRRGARSVLAHSDRLGDGPAADRGSCQACPHHGADAPETHRGALAPLRSRQPVLGTSLPATPQRKLHHPSMSRTSNCWDNACVESFFGIFKRELIHHRQYRTRDEATQNIIEYMEVFYNR
jgi:integrase-like protein